MKKGGGRDGSTQGETGERVEKVGGEEKCEKERVKSWGNGSCCPSALLLLQVSDEFLLFGFPDAHSFHCLPCVSSRRITFHFCMDRGD